MTYEPYRRIYRRAVRRLQAVDTAGGRLELDRQRFAAGDQLLELVPSDHRLASKITCGPT
jgi:hypothetical protein